MRSVGLIRAAVPGFAAGALYGVLNALSADLSVRERHFQPLQRKCISVAGGGKMKRVFCFWLDKDVFLHCPELASPGFLEVKLAGLARYLQR